VFHNFKLQKAHNFCLNDYEDIEMFVLKLMSLLQKELRNKEEVSKEKSNSVKKISEMISSFSVSSEISSGPRKN
jgi:hypothetical protein